MLFQDFRSLKHDDHRKARQHIARQPTLLCSSVSSWWAISLHLKSDEPSPNRLPMKTWNCINAWVLRCKPHRAKHYAYGMPTSWQVKYVSVVDKQSKCDAEAVLCPSYQQSKVTISIQTTQGLTYLRWSHWLECAADISCWRRKTASEEQHDLPSMFR